jgi:hypothetical protein
MRACFIGGTSLTNKCIKFVNTACKDIKKSQAMEFLFENALFK